MKVGLVQIDLRVGDLEGNRRGIVELARAAAAEGAGLIVFPELAVTGYPPRDLLLDERFVAAALASTHAIAADLAAHGAAFPPVILGSVAAAPLRPPGHPGLHDVACMLVGGEVAATRAKRLLPPYDVFHEPRWFVPGTAADAAPVPVAGRRLGLLVCEDLWSPGYEIDPGSELLAAGADLLVCISASPFRKDVLARRLALARRHRAPVVYLNAVGATDELIFDGRSFVLGAGGRLLGLGPAFEEAVTIIDLDGETEALPEPAADGEAEVFAALVLGVRDFARKNGIRRAVLGLSGGVDSALVACIGREALGPENVLAIAIPGRYTDPRSTTTARELASALGIGFEVVELEALHAQARVTLAPLLADLAQGQTVDENLQARLRMLVLMAHVNRLGGMLLNTSNKTELALGYGTLYADLAGTLCVIGDLTKPEVYALARHYDERRGGVIPRFILEREPSAELKPDQVDPFDYPRVAPIVESLVQGQGLPDGIEAGEEELASWRRRIRLAEHKRWQSGIVLKVSEKAFGTGRMMPVARAW